MSKEINQMLNSVREFQVASDQPVNDKPTLEGINVCLLRHDLMEEENEEYHHNSVTEPNLVEILDACVDQLYILLGTVNTHGLQDVFQEAFERVHANNMTKVVDGKVIRNEAGKILKPEGFKPVDLSDLV